MFKWQLISERVLGKWYVQVRSEIVLAEDGMNGKVGAKVLVLQKENMTEWKLLASMIGILVLFTDDKFWVQHMLDYSTGWVRNTCTCLHTIAMHC